jgi:osmotically-inducible protein OsmY
MKRSARAFPEGTLSVLLFLTAVLILGSNLRAAAQSRPPSPRDTAKYDAWLTKEVRHQLLMLPWFSVFDNLEYKVDRYTVTLYGQVTRPVLKDEAESAVKHLEGVEKVVNQIEVLPPSPMDDRIRRQEFRAIFSFGPLEQYAIEAVPSIHIIVKGGHVTLEGVVASEADKNAAYIRARSVPGVFSVTNHLSVEKEK